MNPAPFALGFAMETWENTKAVIAKLDGKLAKAKVTPSAPGCDKAGPAPRR